MIVNQIYGGGKENLDQQLNTQDTLLATLQNDINALPDTGGDSSEPQYVEIDISTSTSGTLTTDQLNILKASNQNYIKCKISRSPMETYSFTNIIEMRLAYTRTKTNNDVTTNNNIYSCTNYDDGSMLLLDTDTGVYEYSSQQIQPSIDYYVTLQIDNYDSDTSSVTTSGTLTDEEVSVIEIYHYSAQVRFMFSNCTLRYAETDNGKAIYTGIGADDKYYKAELDTSNKTWVLSEKSMIQEYVYKSITYDNTTLGAHIDEIKGMLNNENGGTLVKIGFKVGTASLVVNAYSITTDLQENSVTYNGYSAQALGAGKYYEFIPSSITSSNTWTLNGSVGNFAETKLSGTIVSNATIAMENNQYTLSATCSYSTNDSGAADNGFVLYQYGFGGLNIANLTLEHLTIVYMEHNNA